ncbi:MAG: hypothetical protein WC628_02525 [Candidatus Omnitrophota bacterium]
MLKEPRPMREIHEIQEKLYEERKKMSSEEKIAAIHLEAEEAEKKFGLTLRKVSHVK